MYKEPQQNRSLQVYTIYLIISRKYSKSMHEWNYILQLDVTSEVTVYYNRKMLMRSLKIIFVG